MKRLLVVFLFFAVNALAGALPLTNTHWELVSYTLGGKSYTAPTDISRPRLSFLVDAKTVNGFGGCNQYTGRYSSEKTTLLVANIASTKRACRAAAMDLETRFFQLLTSAEKYTANPKTLLVSSGKGNALVFTRTMIR
jgi:putative lipoprotein